jgi:hypothetical protein
VALLTEPERLRQFKRRGLEVAQAFSKQRWDARWDKLLGRHLPEPPPSPTPGRDRIVEVKLEGGLTRAEVLKKLVLPLLARRDTVIYMRAKRKRSQMPPSHGRLQFLEWDEEIYTAPDRVVVDPGAAQPNPATIVFDNHFEVSRLNLPSPRQAEPGSR